MSESLAAQVEVHAFRGVFAALVLIFLFDAIAPRQVAASNYNTTAFQLADGPEFLQHLQAFILCLSDCKNLIFINEGVYPSTFRIKIHVFSSHPSALQLSSDASTERCDIAFSILERGVFAGSFGGGFPPLYFVAMFLVRDPFRDTPRHQLHQTLFFHFDIDVTSWKCGRHAAKVVPSSPIRISSQSVFMKIERDPEVDHVQHAASFALAPGDISADFTAAMSASDSVVVVSWMVSLKRHAERWRWGSTAASSVGLLVRRWLAVDGRLEAVRKCIDIDTSFARAFTLPPGSEIQPYSALACALSHKLLHRTIATSGPFAGVPARHVTDADRHHGPGNESDISCEALRPPENLTTSAKSDVDWVVVMEDDVQPDITADDMRIVLQTIPLNFDLIWLGHCACNWNGPAALPGEVAPVVSVGISRGRVVQLWRGWASCTHAYAVNPSSTHVTSSFINMFEGVQWKPACEGKYLRCLVAVVVSYGDAAYVEFINGLPGLFLQNKDLASEIHPVGQT
jgi:hypothetical protein